MLSLNDKKIVPILILALIITMIFAVVIVTQDKDIHEATLDDIRAVDGLDIVLATRVFNYIEDNPNADIDDLIDIKGIGPKRIKLLKGKFR